MKKGVSNERQGNLDFLTLRNTMDCIHMLFHANVTNTPEREKAFRKSLSLREAFKLEVANLKLVRTNSPIYALKASTRQVEKNCVSVSKNIIPILQKHLGMETVAEAFSYVYKINDAAKMFHEKGAHKAAEVCKRASVIQEERAAKQGASTREQYKYFWNNLRMNAAKSQASPPSFPPAKGQ